MQENRKSQRRHAEMTATFPLRLVGSRVAYERRCLPDRRLSGISVKEVDCMDYVFEVIKRDK
jgi:hypothetical protein